MNKINPATFWEIYFNPKRLYLYSSWKFIYIILRVFKLLNLVWRWLMMNWWFVILNLKNCYNTLLGIAFWQSDIFVMLMEWHISCCVQLKAVKVYYSQEGKMLCETALKSIDRLSSFPQDRYVDNLVEVCCGPDWVPWSCPRERAGKRRNRWSWYTIILAWNIT